MIELLLHWIFERVVLITDNYGLSLIILSIVVNIILIPVYYPIEKIKKSIKEKQKGMDIDIEEIKDVYKGQERYYYVNAIHRQYKFNPLKSLIPSLGLLIQIPFFMAAYKMLSHYTGYSEVSFLFIKDLSLADGSINLGYAALNILPIIMTLLNVISSFVYTSGSDKKERYQLLGLATLFLFLLYKSPSGLVLYWTMNNVFVLFKQMFQNKKLSIKINLGTKKLLFFIYYFVLAWTVFIAVSTLSHNDTSTMTPIYSFASIFVCLFILESIGGIYLLKEKNKNLLIKGLIGLFVILFLIQIVLSVPIFGNIVNKELEIKESFIFGFIQGLSLLITMPFFIKSYGIPKLFNGKMNQPSKVLVPIVIVFITTLILFWIPMQI